MIRTVFRNRIRGAAVLALATFLVSPIAGVDDYCMLHAHGKMPMHAGPLCTGPATPEGGAMEIEVGDFHVCPCMVCLETLGESFAPDVQAMQPVDVLRQTSIVLAYASHLPGVFRPPIA